MQKHEVFGYENPIIEYLDRVSKMRKYTGFKRSGATIEKLTETFAKDAYKVQLVYSQPTHFQLRLITDKMVILLYYHYWQESKGFTLSEIDIKQRGI